MIQIEEYGGTPIFRFAAGNPDIQEGQIKELNLKEFHEDVLYKKAGFSSPNGFHCIKRDCWKQK